MQSQVSYVTEYARRWRAAADTEGNVKWREITTLTPELEEMLYSAQANQALIKSILEEMRTFLAAEFPFKESF
jgi:hypothetical protein